MSQAELVRYIKKTLNSGFPEEKIKEALLQAGWQAPDIDQAFDAAKPATPAAPPRSEEALLPAEANFFVRHRLALLVSLGVIIALPLLAYGGFWLYGKLATLSSEKAREEQPLPPTTNQITESSTEELERQAEERDQKRLADVQSLQTALQNYFASNQGYPQAISELVNAGLLTALPTDPKTNQPHLYTALGNPPLYYAISFLLETKVGALGPGLISASSDKPLGFENLLKQEESIKGEMTPASGSLLEITDLGQTPFYPEEEVSLEVAAPNLEIISVTLVMENLDLTDKTPPYGFRFTAPQTPGSYQVKVIAFAKSGEIYSKSTVLTVR